MEVRDKLEQISNELTATERRLASALLLDYPFAGLEPIQKLAERANTSPPSISRFVTKLGFQGFQDFRQHLIVELRQGQRSPVDLRETSKPMHGDYLDTFLKRAERILRDSTTAISEVQFMRVCNLLADQRRSIYVIGGRMSDTLSLFMSRHLRQARDKVHHLPPDPEAWPEYLLRMRSRDVLFVADFRRYQNSLLRLSKKATRDRKVQIILLTDQWLSPISKNASEVLAVPIDSSTLWDSYSGAFAVIEAIVTQIADANWKTTKQRIEHWDSMRLDFGEDQNDL